ncbi:MAG: hypothetical protein DSZ05_05910, partial [Sulfurospirillum sp.]
ANLKVNLDVHEIYPISIEKICADGHSPICDFTPILVLLRVKLVFWGSDNVADDPPLFSVRLAPKGGGHP